MINSQIRLYNEEVFLTKSQQYQEFEQFEQFEPEQESQEQQNFFNISEESNQQLNRFKKKNKNQNSIQKKNISKKNKENILLQQEWKYLNGLLDKFIQESIKEANKGFEIKQFIDKMERALINMKSLLLSHMLNRKS